MHATPVFARSRGLLRSWLLAALGAVAVVSVGPACAQAASAAKPGAAVERETPVANPPLDRSGRRRIGTASVYAPQFAGRKMADGTPMDPRDDNAASKTLPLGTEAKVTNLETGRSATVKIQDRGPYVKGRIVDLSRSTASRIGISPKEGVAKVEVEPVAVPSK
jgi:rare lipoprotein A